ncbi:MAG: uracil phosphoribosyltransferase [Ruminococcus sp.]|nr:uracil phosphoribosyltransferase [Ruminococcus sp.]MBQ8906608.1 uracil phosphoribosyltransferase [Ruminococcus sp.]
MGVHYIEHPLVQHKITLMRDKTTGSKEFRELIAETAMLMCYEATRDLPTKEIDITTPIAMAKSKIISGRKLAFVPILRAGLGMMDGVMSMVPAAKVGHIGVFRDPGTHTPVEYYVKLPEDIAERDAILLDPMLATGQSAIHAVDLLKQAGVVRIKFMCIIASPEGLEALTAAHPDIDIYCGVQDACLNADKYIVPGLGDAGDRIFGTK